MEILHALGDDAIATLAGPFDATIRDAVFVWESKAVRHACSDATCHTSNMLHKVFRVPCKVYAQL